MLTGANVVVFGSIHHLSSSHRNVSFLGVIPGGQSFGIPNGPLSTNSATGTGFNWIPDIRGGTNILLVANDNSGMGAGGSSPFTVGYSSNGSCLSSDSPSSTPGNAAGALPTNAPPGSG